MIPSNLRTWPYHYKAYCSWCQEWYLKPKAKCNQGHSLRQWPNSKKKVLYKKLYSELMFQSALGRELTLEDESSLLKMLHQSTST